MPVCIARGEYVKLGARKFCAINRGELRLEKKKQKKTNLLKNKL
jgi:hypothetical protein